jgi:NADH:ubiquinone oxidoreductase subunit F (NADH-binding)
MTSVLAPGLLEAPGPRLADHLATFGPLPPDLPDSAALDLAQGTGLTGRGGAGFPTAVKLRSVVDAARAARRSPVVVANGAEGEPAAAKDAVLLTHGPHLVLDGLALVARALGADTLVLAAAPHLLGPLAERLAERPDRFPVRLHPAADRFLAGEESALVAAVDGGEPLPRAKFPPIRERGVGGRPTLVQNVETLARLALAARGDRAATTRTLVTRRLQVGGSEFVDVADAPLGTRLGDVLPLDRHATAVLVGGYHGSWLPADVARDLPLDREGLASVGAALGAGVLAALPADRCGLRETARVVGYLAAESAGQCGPCLNGLPRIAAALKVLARPGQAPPRLLDDVARWSQLVAGRGACGHPDGSVRLVASALQVFAPELELHRGGRCSGSGRPFLPVPGARA